MKRMPCQPLGVALTVVAGVGIEGDALVVSRRPRRGRRPRRPGCGRRRPRHDAPRAPRRWGAPDPCSTRCCLEYAPSRARRPGHGARVEAVPWAPSGRPRFTRAFEGQVAWPRADCSSSTVAGPMRVGWRAVGGICARVEARPREAAGRSRLDGLRGIGVDETGHARGHNYLTAVVDHDRGRVAWRARGHDRATPGSSFGPPTEAQPAATEVVTRDGASRAADVVAERCPNAGQATGPFHAARRVADALDEARGRAWREAGDAAGAARKSAPGRGPGGPRAGEARPELEARAAAGAIRGGRYALLEGPEGLTEGQSGTLAAIERESPAPWRAYNLEERFRDAFKSPDVATAEEGLGSWISWAQRRRVPEMVKARRSVRKGAAEILRPVGPRISNARVEAINGKIEVTQRMAYGFRNVGNLTALIMLRCSGLTVSLPGRTAS